MKINRENYESFFLDYLENNLKEELIDQFLDFLEQNHDLKEELHLFEHFNLVEEEIVFSDKNKLYKSEPDEKAALENKFIASLEGDLEYPEQLSLKDYLATQPELQKEYNLFAKTRLIPDPAVIYTGKHKLKRRSRSVILMNWMAAAAALLLLIWGISSVIPKANQPGIAPRAPEIAEMISKPILQAEKKEEVVANSVTAKELKLISAPESKTEPKQNVDTQKETGLVETQITELNTHKSGADELAEISPKMARLESAEIATQLEFSSPAKKEAKSGESGKALTIEEFLAVKAKKVSNDGLVSVQRIARAGLDVASELSGERIGYVEKNGKIKSIEFESKLFVFSIPLKKK